MNIPIDAAAQRQPPRKAAQKQRGRATKDAAERAAADAEARERLSAMAQAPVQRNRPREIKIKQTREVARETTRENAVIATGRGGEVLTRRRISQGPDIFEIPASEIPPGWSYQWNTFSIHNEEQINDQVQMHENGWRPVPAERHPGRWLKPGATGQIVVKGLRLEERPLSLTQEAAEEDKLAARKQMRDQTDALKLTQKLPHGFTDQIHGRRNVLGAHGSVQMKIDPTLDIPTGGDYRAADDNA